MIGCGRMGQALYGGWINSDLAIDKILLVDPHAPPPSLNLRDQDRWTADTPVSMTHKPDVIVVAIKPQMMDRLLPAYADLIKPDTMVISIAAGVSIEKLSKLLNNPSQPVVRTMPNTPAMIGQGMTVGTASTAVTEQQSAVAETLLRAVGDFLWVDNEDLLHAVTGVSGSGPAYVFAMIEALAKAGEVAGLDPVISMHLARQTVIGSAALAASQPDVPASALRDNVTSPGGTTAEGLIALLNPETGLTPLMTETVRMATARSRSLGKA